MPNMIDSSEGVNVVTDANPITLVNRGLAWAIIITFVLSIFFIFYGGISFVLSGGKEDKIKKAVNTIRYAIIGLIVTILATTIITIIGKIFSLDFIGQIVNFNQIFSDINSIIETFSNSSSTGKTQLMLWLMQ